MLSGDLLSDLRSCKQWLNYDQAAWVPTSHLTSELCGQHTLDTVGVWSFSLSHSVPAYRKKGSPRRDQVTCALRAGALVVTHSPHTTHQSPQTTRSRTSLVGTPLDAHTACTPHATRVTASAVTQLFHTRIGHRRTEW